MLPNLPIYLPIVFALTTLLTLFLFYRVLAASACYGKKAPQIALIIAGWLALQGILAFVGFYSQETLGTPPRVFLMIAPPLLAITVTFAWKRGRRNRLPRAAME